MSYLEDDQYDRVLKNAKYCLGSVKDLADKYDKLSKDHKEFEDMIRDLGLSTLTSMTELVERQFRCIKYMEELDKNFVGGPASALVEGGKSNTSVNEVAKIISTAVEPSISRAKSEIVAFLNEAICADLSASSDAILSSNAKFKEEMGNTCKAGLSEIDKLVSAINDFDIDF